MPRHVSAGQPHCGSNAITGCNGEEGQAPSFSKKQPGNKREKGGSPPAPLGTLQDESTFSPNTQREHRAASRTYQHHGPNCKSPRIPHTLAPTLPTHRVQGSFRSTKLSDLSTCSRHVPLPAGKQDLRLGQGTKQVGLMQQPSLINTTNPMILTQLTTAGG